MSARRTGQEIDPQITRMTQMIIQKKRAGDCQPLKTINENEN